MDRSCMWRLLGLCFGLSNFAGLSEPHSDYARRRRQSDQFYLLACGGKSYSCNPDIKWRTSKERTNVLLQESLEQFGAGDFSMAAFIKLIKGTALAGDTYGSAFDVTDNELLGIKELAPADLKKLIAEKLT